MLERFSGYTLSTLMDEDVELLRMMKIEALGRRPDDQDPPPSPEQW
jgi:hypothetical protein